MANKLKIRVEINKGRIGVPLHKLANIAEESEKFLKMLSEDMSIDIEKGQWIALNFKNGSVIHDIEYRGETSEVQRKDCLFYLEQIMSNPEEAINGKIRRKTVLQYANIADPLDVDEPIEFGIYKNGDAKPSDTYQLSKQVATSLITAVEEIIEYYGAVLGTVHDLNLGGAKPLLKIRDLVSNELIKCYFADQLYGDVIDLLKRRKGIINVSGLITANRVEKRIESIMIGSEDKIELAEEYRAGDLEKFFGCVPDLLGEMSLQDYMDEVRGRND